jgi:hypothetical protein
VDRRRVRLAVAAEGGLPETMRAFEDFRRDVLSIGTPDVGALEEPDVVCEPTPVLTGRGRR